MRSKDEVRKRLQDLQKGIQFWKAEANKKHLSQEYRHYVRCILAELSREIKALRWVLGEDIELPPTG